MKLQAFPGCSGATVAGEQITIDKDGTCDVSPAAAKELCESHGFTVFGAQKAAPPIVIEDKFSDMGRAEVIGYIRSKGVSFAPSADSDALRAIARSQYTPAEREADAAALADKARG
jgi:hypothetical protein